MDFVPVEIEVVAYVTDLKSLDTNALVSYRCLGEVRLSIVAVEQPEEEAAES